MPRNFRREEIYPKVYFNSYIDDKYKYNRLSINMLMPLEYSTVSDFALLSGVIGKSCKKYDSMMKLNIKLSDLYGANLSSDVIKIGEAQGITLHLSFISNKYTLYKEDVCEQAVKLLFDVLLDPNIDQGMFNNDEVEIEKDRLVELIDSEINDKRRYAITNCLKNMCKDEPYSIPKYGYKDRVEEISSSRLYNSYLNMLKKSRIEVFFVGTDNDEPIKQEVKKLFYNIKRKPINDISTIVNDTVYSVSNITENMNISQSKLVMGFKSGKLKTPEQNIVMMIAMLMYGITSNSKLFLNVRERLSLCYYCSVQYDRYKSILFVDSGIEHEKKDEAVLEILSQLEKMKSGDFSDEEVASALKFYINGYNGLYDSPGSVEAFYLGNVIFGSDLEPDEMIEIAKSVSREDIINICKDINLDTIYFLTGENK